MLPIPIISIMEIAGRPGTLITFFPFQDAAPGRIGTGMADVTTFAIPEGALEPWMLRFAELGYETNGPFKRFGADILGVSDPDGLRIELVAESEQTELVDERGISQPDTGRARHMPASFDLTLCRSARTHGAIADRNIRLPTDRRRASRQRFRIRTGGSAGIVDIQCNPELMRGRMGAGTVHHVAFRARDDAEQLKWRESILAL